MSKTDSAMECARYIFDSDSEQISYQEYIQDGNDPRDHILYHAAVVLDQDIEEFNNDIQQYLIEIDDTDTIENVFSENTDNL